MSERKTTKNRQPPPAPKLTPTPEPAPDPFGFWKTKTVEELATQMGVKPVTNVEDLSAPPGSLWRDDQEFESFLAWLRASRQEGG